MQFAKDSFYMELRTRLAALNPARVVTIDGVSQTAILATENEVITAAEAFGDCFYVAFHAAKPVPGAPGMMAIEASITYRTRGQEDGSADRGRSLGQLDTELVTICSPNKAAKCDYTASVPVDLGTTVFWSSPVLGETKVSGAELQRRAMLSLYFYPEEAV